MATLLGVAVVFLVIALISYILGAKGVAGLSMGIAKILLVVFVVLFMLALVFGVVLNI